VRTLLATTICSSASIAAHAQSSVTLYGILDAGVEYVTHAAKQGSGNLWRLNTGNRINSRWGFTGKEDLGAGLRSIFTLESGFATNNGTLQQGGRLFGRQAFVGLESDTFGAVMAGRQMTPMYRFFLALDPLNYSSYGLSAQDAQFVGRAATRSSIWDTPVRSSSTRCTASVTIRRFRMVRRCRANSAWARSSTLAPGIVKARST
jgi:predicted porin